MIIKTLVENTSISEDFGSEHGLSLYIETKNHKLLFDTGASELFAENAKKMGVDLSAVDVVVLSHGHYDHGGGLKTFLALNAKAKIYLNEKCFEKRYANKPNGGKTYIGLDETLVSNNRFIFVGNQLVIDEELELFSNVKGKKFNPSGNQDLLMERDTLLVQDDFAHEQNLIIKEDIKKVLLAGCAHNGILNIMDRFKDMEKATPDFVIGGFHLYNRSRNENEDVGLVRQMGEHLKKTSSKYYTCHCTGVESYKILKEIMGQQIDYLATGSQVVI